MFFILPVGDDNPRRHFPVVNLFLIAANVGVFLFYAFDTPDRAECFILRWGLVPASWRPETLVTSIFLHGGIAHLLGNMLFLWIAGDNVEDRVGHIRYLLLYLFLGVAAGAAHVIFNPASLLPCVGASGAISGVLAGYLVLFPGARIRFAFIFVIFRLFSFPMPALVAIGFWFLEQVFLAHLARVEAVTQVAYDAHIGGFSAGFIILLAARMTGMVKGGTRRRG
ncbi:MAG: rhomboid family intramembrane serine protease [Planctomycetota bacterium]